MKPVYFQSRMNRDQNRTTSTRTSSDRLRRRDTLIRSLETLEERTLLSATPMVDVFSPIAAMKALNTGNVPANLPAGLVNSVNLAHTLANVTLPTQGSSTGQVTSQASIFSSHIYTGHTQSFLTPPTSATSTGHLTPPAPGSQSGPNGLVDPGKISSGLAGASGAVVSAPQFLILPTGVNPHGGEGPGGGLSPRQLRGAYGIDQIQFSGIVGDGTGQTIAIIDAGDNSSFVSTSDPNYQYSALHIFNQYFGLPDPPSFQKYTQDGTPGGTGVSQGWELEIALDIEWAHAMAPMANIILVEGDTASFVDLGTAVLTASTLLHASVVSMSYGGTLEGDGYGSYQSQLDSTYLAPALAANPGITFLASTGDNGAATGLLYPSSSPLVVAVGGTSLAVSGTTWNGETGWSGGGGGISTNYPAPSYQSPSVTGQTARTAPDISSDADPYTGVSVYDPAMGGWGVVGGTSLSSPTWAGMIAIANQGRQIFGGSALSGPTETLPGLYSAIDYSRNYHDITAGNNGYPAGVGYDLVTGIGSPVTPNILTYLSTYQLGPSVVSASPTKAQVVTSTPPTSFTLTFGEPIVATSISAADFTVNGIPADSATLSSDGLTISYGFNASPVTIPGSQTLSLASHAVTGVSSGLSNVSRFTSSFYYTDTQLAVVGTNPTAGSVLTVEDTTSLVVSFNTAYDPSSVQITDFQISQGTVTAAVVDATNPDAIDLTLSGVNQDGSVSLTIATGAILDAFGVPGLAYSASYVVDIVSQAYPTLASKPPVGSLIYDPSIRGTVGFTQDKDTYTLPLAAGQQLTLALVATDPGLIGVITLLDPQGNIVASSAAPAAGQVAILQNAPVLISGTYALVVSGDQGTTGAYTLQAILNAVYKPATVSNTTLETSFDINSAFLSLGTSPASDRAGVVAKFAGTPGTSGLQEYYTFQAEAGVATTIVAKGMNDAVSLSLYDSSGSLLSLGAHPGHDVDSVISNFFPMVTGSYYVKVTGAAGQSYDLVLTRGAAFSLHGYGLSNAQPLVGTGVAMGAILEPSGSFFVLDDQFGQFGQDQNPIWSTDPATGVFLAPAISAPGSSNNNPFGLNLAYDGQVLYYNNGQYRGDNTIYQLDPATGQVLASTVPPLDVPPLSGLAYLDGKLYGTAGYGYGPTEIYVFDAETLAYESTLSVSISDTYLTGLTADPGLGVLFAVGPYGANQLYEIDPATGRVLAQAPDQSQGALEQDIAFVNGQLIVADTDGFGSGKNYLDYYDPSSFAFIQRVPVAAKGYVSGLGGDGLGGVSSDWYSFQVNAGDSLTITTTTPGGSTASGLQFTNDLAPTLNLYDASGNLVATATANAADGRNDILAYTTLTPGKYRVQVLSTNKTYGEYTVSVEGATTPAPPFVVTSTNPASGADLGMQISSMTVTVSAGILLTSVDSTDFMIDGQYATGVDIVDDHTLRFSFNTTTNGVHSVGISGLENLQGAALTPRTLTFQTDDVPPVVLSSSIVDGSVFPLGALTEVITFSKPVDPASVSEQDFLLVGTLRGRFYLASAFSLDATDTILTLQYTNIPPDQYTFTLQAGPTNYLSTAGVPMVNNYDVHFSMVLGTSKFPVPFQPVAPAGSLIFAGNDTDSNLSIVTSSDVNTLTVNLNAGETLSLVGTAIDPNLQLSITLLDPNGNAVATATAASPGVTALIQTAAISLTGLYSIQISGYSGSLGRYSIKAYLNTFVEESNSNESLATAEDLSSSSYALGTSGADRLAVVGTLFNAPKVGDVYVSSRYYGYFNGRPEISDILRVDQQGNIVQVIPVVDGILSGVMLDPLNNMLYAAVTTSWNPGSVDGALLEFDPTTGQQVATIPLPSDPANDGYFYPYGFGIAPDGSFWIPQPNSSNILHLDAGYSVLSSYSTGVSLPESASVGADGNIYFSGGGYGTSQVYQLNPSTGAITPFAFSPYAQLTSSAPGTQGIWIGDYVYGALSYDYQGNFLGQYGYEGTTQAQNDSFNHVWTTNFSYGGLFEQTELGSYVLGVGAPGAVGLTIWGTDNPTPPETGVPTYSFNLTAGQNVTIVSSGASIGITLLDAAGHTLASSLPGATNVTESIENFKAESTGMYFVQVSGTSNQQYSLTVTRGSTFTLKPNDTSHTAQSLTRTEGVLGALENKVTVQQTIEGLSFQDTAGYIPPDTNAAVGGDYIIETVNLQIRIYDKHDGSILLNESLSDFFAPLGVNTLSDPYVVFDSNINRWFVIAIGSGAENEIQLAVSNSANPMDGFNTQFMVPVSAPVTTADFPKVGYNADAFVIEANEFGDGHAVVTTVDIAQLLAGNLVFYQSTPAYNFRALTPAQMHGAKSGDPMWFMASTGDPTYNGTIADTIRVTRMDNVLSDTPTYTDYAVRVKAYGPNYGRADQPYGPGSVATNDVSTTQVDYLNGSLVTALSASTAADGFLYTKALWYQVDVSSGTPALVQEGVVDPGNGVSTYFPSASQDAAGNIALTYMESSLTEYVSAYLAGHIAGSLPGSTTPGTAFAPGEAYEYSSDRNGDYSTVVLDPSTGLFWAANEYVGADSYYNSWRTKIAAFAVSASASLDSNWYSINVHAGNVLNLQTFTPSDQGGEFQNTLNPQIDLYDTFGTLVSSGSELGDGRNEWLSFTAPASGRYLVKVSSSGGTSGTYYLQTSTQAYSSGELTGQVYNDIYGHSTNGGTMVDWKVELYDSTSTLVATQWTYGAGVYDFGGLELGSTYTVVEVPYSGWTQTDPVAPHTYSVTLLTDGEVVSGLNFGNFKNVSLAGLAFEDMNGDGLRAGSDPALPGWTIDLVNSSGEVVMSTQTDSSGHYLFTNVGPGDYRLLEGPMTGWVTTSPVTSGEFLVTPESGQDLTWLDFGNFQRVTISGLAFNDLNGNGIQDTSDPVLAGQTINLFDSKGTVISSIQTDSSGNYSFADVGPGTYTIREQAQDGWEITAPGYPTDFTVSALSGQDVQGLSFGNFQRVALSGTVFNDVNGDGVLSAGDTPLSGWTLQFFQGGVQVNTLTTDASGNYLVPDLGPGSYTVVEVAPAGWMVTTPANSHYTFDAISGQSVSGLSFGNFQLVTYSGRVFNDLNGDGVQGTYDKGLVGWTVSLFKNGTLFTQATTGGEGQYGFTNLAPGAYTIQEVAPAGWLSTAPATPGSYSLTASSGQNLSALLFGNFQTATLGGTVYNDANGNGVQDAGELGLSGWSVNLLNSASVVVATATSNSQGQYQFNNVGPGSFSIQEIVQSGWIVTQPNSNPNVYKVATVSGLVSSGFAFGDHIASALLPTMVIDNGQTGYSESGTWKGSTAGGYNGNNRYASTVRGSTPTNTAAWTFTTLATGTYDVYVTYYAQNANTTAAPFSVYNNTTKLATYNINESIPASRGQGSFTVGTYGGVSWLGLGSVVIDSGILKVMLPNTTPGGVVDADGVLIIMHPAIGGNAVLGGSGSGSSPGTGAGTGTGRSTTTGTSSDSNVGDALPIGLLTLPGSETGLVTNAGLPSPAPVTLMKNATVSSGSSPALPSVVSLTGKLVNQAGSSSASVRLLDLVLAQSTLSTSRHAATDQLITSVAEELLSAKQSG